MKSTFTFSLHLLITETGQFTSEILNSLAKKHSSNLRRLKNIYIRGAAAVGIECLTYALALM